MIQTTKHKTFVSKLALDNSDDGDSDGDTRILSHSFTFFPLNVCASLFVCVCLSLALFCSHYSQFTYVYIPKYEYAADTYMSVVCVYMYTQPQ